jgi:hypothetical protein
MTLLKSVLSAEVAALQKRTGESLLIADRDICSTSGIMRYLRMIDLSAATNCVHLRHWCFGAVITVVKCIV